MHISYISDIPICKSVYVFEVVAVKEHTIHIGYIPPILPSTVPQKSDVWLRQDGQHESVPPPQRCSASEGEGGGGSGGWGH